jgi:hypothetical protein
MRAKRFVVVSIALAVACKPPTAAEQMDSVLSWVATAGVTGEAWLRHTTPDKYSQQTLQLSDQTVLQISTELLKSPPKSIDSATLDSVITKSREHIAQMARLIEAKNAPAFGQQLDSLRVDEKIIKQLSDSIQSSQ